MDGHQLYWVWAPAWISIAIITILYVLYRRALPKPIPGIPHNELSARRLSGDGVPMLALQKAGKRPIDYWGHLCIEKQSPIVQVFPPFSKPFVIIADCREAQDLLIQRKREVDQGSMNRMLWSGLIPTHFIGLESKHPVAQQSKHLVKDVMSTNYIATVCYHSPISQQRTRS